MAARKYLGEEWGVKLTPREYQIVQLLRTGLEYKEIGAQLHCAKSTVKYHMHNICGKFGVSTRLELLQKIGFVEKL
jgi:DNA-binding NarL/FixJ family response regulator